MTTLTRKTRVVLIWLFRNKFALLSAWCLRSGKRGFEIFDVNQQEKIKESRLVFELKVLKNTVNNKTTANRSIVKFILIRSRDLIKHHVFLHTHTHTHTAVVVIIISSSSRLMRARERLECVWVCVKIINKKHRHAVVSICGRQFTHRAQIWTNFFFSRLIMILSLPSFLFSRLSNTKFTHTISFSHFLI